jgi:rSAM/selenodomain-associated transferase 2
MSNAPALSVIIPALNEERYLGVLLARLKAMPEVGEIIVADGGSADATVAIARSCGAKIARGRGRGAQMNAGAQIAGGRVLWFLHADAQPHPRAAAAIRRAVQDPRMAGGNFRLKFAANTPAARVFENIARLQRRCGIYYGDSGLWLRHEVFAELGGYRDWPLFVDYDLARRLEEYARRHGGRTARLWPALMASARRFETRPWSTLGKWMALQLLFRLGVAPQKLARLYHSRAETE